MDDSTEHKPLHPARRNAVELTPTMQTQEKRLRMVVLGASGVGKTQLVSRFLDRPFNESYLPTAEEFHRAKYIIQGHTYQLDILDMAGQTISPLMLKLTLLTGDLFLVVYSVTERGSWERARDIVSSIEEATSDPEWTNKCIERSFKALLHSEGSTSIHCDKFKNGIQQRTKYSQNVTPIPILVVGNKCDAPNVSVQAYETAEWLNQRNPNPASTVDHILASAKTSYNVQDLYDRIFEMSHLPFQMSPNMHRRVPESEYFNVKLNNGSKNRSKKERRPKSYDGKNLSVRSVTKSDTTSAGSLSASSSDSEDRESISTPNAIAAVCLNQRRPSVDTEVILAITKIRAQALESQRSRKKVSYSTIRKQIDKIRISTHSS